MAKLPLSLCGVSPAFRQSLPAPEKHWGAPLYQLLCVREEDHGQNNCHRWISILSGPL
jgi:hypothetical protein